MIKFVFNKPYKNDFNIDNQVGIRAIKVLGNSFEEIKRYQFNEMNDAQEKPGDELSSTSSSTISDLSSMTYGNEIELSPELAALRDEGFDIVTAKQILSLQSEKEVAIHEENFDRAKAVVFAMRNLREKKEILADLETKKFGCVVAENFKEAGKIKRKIDKIRKECLGPTEWQPGVEVKERKGNKEGEGTDEVVTVVEDNSTNPTKEGFSDPNKRPSPFDDPNNAFPSPPDDEPKVKTFDDLKSTYTLTPDERAIHSMSIQVFGEGFVACLLSPQWTEREEAWSVLNYVVDDEIKRVTLIKAENLGEAKRGKKDDMPENAITQMMVLLKRESDERMSLVGVNSDLMRKLGDPGIFRTISYSLGKETNPSVSQIGIEAVTNMFILATRLTPPPIPGWHSSLLEAKGKEKFIAAAKLVNRKNLPSYYVPLPSPSPYTYMIDDLLPVILKNILSTNTLVHTFAVLSSLDFCRSHIVKSPKVARLMFGTGDYLSGRIRWPGVAPKNNNVGKPPDPSLDPLAFSTKGTVEPVFVQAVGKSLENVVLFAHDMLSYVYSPIFPMDIILGFALLEAQNTNDNVRKPAIDLIGLCEREKRKKDKRKKENVYLFI